MKKLLILLLVLGVASAASAALPVEDFEAKTLGPVVPQGGGIGFTANWADDVLPQVASEVGNQFWRYVRQDTDDDYTSRLFTPLAADTQYTVYLQFRSSQKGGNGADEWGTNTPGGFQLRQDGGPDPLHMKVNQSNNFMLNDGAIMTMDTIPDWYTAGGHTQAEIDDYYENYVGNWADWKFELDLAAQTVDWYWMDNSGNWDHVVQRGMGGAGDVTGVQIDRISLGGYTGLEDISIDYDNFSIVPEPATMVLLGLGGLALIRRKR